GGDLLGGGQPVGGGGGGRRANAAVRITDPGARAAADRHDRADPGGCESAVEPAAGRPAAGGSAEYQRERTGGVEAGDPGGRRRGGEANRRRSAAGDGGPGVADELRSEPAEQCAEVRPGGRLGGGAGIGGAWPEWRRGADQRGGPRAGD